MVDDMDSALRLLAESPVPDALTDIDAGVFARIANRRTHDLGRSVIVGAAAFALATGIGAGLWPIAPSQSAETLAPLVDASSLAPSSLLASHQ
ncbi:MAG TPA: hypothetical protein VM657_00200 [Sphingomonas sp.]|jgi:hypothetical protein|nr:hypothetical protein [Sphingomonas sp.]